VASLLLAFGSFALLAIATPRYPRQSLCGRVVGARLVRLTAIFVFFLSAAARGLASDWRFALIEWIGELTLAALVTTMLLTYLPKKLVGAGVLAILCAGVATCISMLT
jgi:hypothetical protein